MQQQGSWYTNTRENFKKSNGGRYCERQKANGKTEKLHSAAMQVPKAVKQIAIALQEVDMTTKREQSPEGFTLDS